MVNTVKVGGSYKESTVCKQEELNMHLVESILEGWREESKMKTCTTHLTSMGKLGDDDSSITMSRFVRREGEGDCLEEETIFYDDTRVYRRYVVVKYYSKKRKKNSRRYNHTI